MVKLSAGERRRVGEVDVDVVGAPREQLVGRDPVELREPEQPRHADRALAPLVGPEHRRLEFLVGACLHIVERQALLSANRA